VSSGGPGPKRVGFLELFFDLVFVFAVTQLVSVLHDDHTTGGWARVGILLWLVWWAWSQYTWAGNAIDVDRRSTRVWVLVATGVMLAAGTTLPDAFADNGEAVAFALLYAAVRVLALALYWFGLADDRAHQAALRTYLPIQLLSPALVVVGGLVGGDAQLWIWVGAIVVDLISVAAAGRGEFRVDPGHFAERHGLIVIIALGESVIVTGLTASELGLGSEVAVLLAIAFVAVAGFWWSYFDWVHEAATERLAGEPDHRRRGHLARDLFTLGHLPIVAGVVVFAAAIETALPHPAETLETFGVTALAVAPTLVLGGVLLGNLRATGDVLMSRLVGLLAAPVLAFVVGSTRSATAAVAAVAAVIVAVAVAETGRSGTAARVTPPGS
jgi:low temperature requirement protein LtrA